MKKKDLFHELSEIMELDFTLAEDDVLTDLAEWDSMTHLATVSLFDMELGVQISTESLHNIKKGSDLIELAKGRIEG